MNVQWDYGTHGNFYYQNNLLFGLDDDTPDNIMVNSDALADSSPYLSADNEINWKMQWENQNVLQNIYSGFFLAYSTPCDTFSVSVSPNTTICRNSTLQLLASGGTQYQWNTSSGSVSDLLSCTTCPNPIFIGDSSRVFTVQIWNNDSCSVVRPVSIRVVDNPNIKSLSVSPTICGLETGVLSSSASATAVLPLKFALDNGAYISSSTYTKSFSGLDSGFVTVHVKDGNGCVTDSVVFVGVSNPTQALFSANPSSGAAPLAVSLTNSSVFATNYEWFLNEEQQNANFSNFLADTSGVYEIKLIAWQHDPKCADTFALTIDVYDSLIFQIPNIFSPNNDGVNDVFGITANIPISVNCLILNRWGNVVSSASTTISSASTTTSSSSSTKGSENFVQLWDGTSSASVPNSTGSASNSTTSPTEALEVANDGVYFYQVEIDLLEKNVNMKIEFPIKKEGYLQLVR